MECYYHPERDGTDQCAICGKSICKECGLEIAGKIYCKECLEKIVGLGIDNKAQQEPQTVVAEEPVRSEPARLNKQPVEENIYEPQAEEIVPTHEIKQISDDSPYNIKDNIEYSGGLESSYISDSEAQQVQVEPQPQITQNEYEPEVARQPVDNAQDFIYPDHSYEPAPTSARVELEDKYEKYLDDLYFDEAEVPLGEQLAKDEEEFGSLTRRPYQPRPEEPVIEKPSRPETPEEMEARIRAKILAEQEGKKGRRGRKAKKSKAEDESIHNLNYKDEKEPMGAVDILLTILLVIVILVVIYYIVYIFVLHATYPTFVDAIYALGNPQNVINNVLTPQPQV